MLSNLGLDAGPEVEQTSWCVVITDYRDGGGSRQPNAFPTFAG